MDKLLYFKISNQRTDEFQMQTAVMQNDDGIKYVIKKNILPCGYSHVLHIERSYQNLTDLFDGSMFEVNVCNLRDDALFLDYIEGETLDNIIDEYLNVGEIHAARDIFISFAQEVRKVYSKRRFNVTEDFVKIFGNVEFIEDEYGCSYIDIDLILSNIIVKECKWYVIDYEWTFDFDIPVDYLLYRVAYYYLLENKMRRQLVGNTIYEWLGINENNIFIYEKMEQCFQRYTKGNKLILSDLVERQKNAGYIDRDDILQKQIDRYIQLQLYYDFGDGFSEENSIIRDLYLDKENKLEVKIELPLGLNSLRIDPMQKKGTLRMDIFFTDDVGKKICAEYDTNGVQINKEEFAFLTDDPQIYIKNLPEYYDYVNIVYYVDFGNYGLLHKYQDDLSNMAESLRKTENNLRKTENNLRKTENNLRKTEDVLRNTKNEKQSAEKAKDEMENLLLEIKNSTSWRITKPLRKISDGIRKNKVLFPMARFVKGITSGNRKDLFPAKKTIFNIEKKKIAVHIHLFYEDLLLEFVSYLKNMPYDFDLFISCQYSANVDYIRKSCKSIKRVHRIDVRKVENRGRDIAPLFCEFGKDVSRYDYFLHVHSKKSLYSGSERISWRNYSLQTLLGSPESISRIFSMFVQDDGIGLVYPDSNNEVPAEAYTWLKNEGAGMQFLKKNDIRFSDKVFMYPAGSFYWARTDAVRTIFDMSLAREDFPEEAGQTDGTLAHVIERCVSIISRNNGYKDAIIDLENDMVHYDKSFKAFKKYADLNFDKMVDMLLEYEIVSFDVFDTLITRLIYEPDDLFYIMEEKIKQKFDIDIDFIKYRKEAEANAWKEKQAYTNIHDIYNELGHLVDCDYEIIEQMKFMEISLENEYIVPRFDMLDVYNKLKSFGKKIILVSDMYLTNDIMEGILKKCGYQGYDRLYISCECGMRKDTDTIWDSIYEEYGDSIMHVGDNTRSDWQILIDKGRKAFWLPNPRDMLCISVYEQYKRYFDGQKKQFLKMGLFFNCGMFNSPFCLIDENAVEFSSALNYGFTVFGPLFYEYLRWLHHETNEDDILLFAAREGYLLKQIYDIMFLDGEKRENYYFLTSRRSVSVAGIIDWNDVRKILSVRYSGLLSNLLYSRLGFSLPDNLEDVWINITKENNDVENLIELLTPYEGELFNQFNKEKSAYMQYIDSLVSPEKWDKLVIADVGYSGTIQYFLAKLLDKKIDGKYLAMFGEKKPELFGCSCKGMYEDTDLFCSEIIRTHLFLEAVLEAPYGQLIKFEVENGKCVPLYKEKKAVPKKIQELQNGILQYCGMRAKYVNDAMICSEHDIAFMEKIYGDLTNGVNMSEELAYIFQVEDDYCMNGMLKFDKAANEWRS